MDAGIAPDNYHVLARRPGFLIRRLHQIHLALFAEACGTFGVTPVQYSILTVASAHPGLDQAALAIEVGVDRATVADVLARLERRGLVRRSRAARDARLKLVHATSRAAGCCRAWIGTRSVRTSALSRLCRRGPSRLHRRTGQAGGSRQRSGSCAACAWHEWPLLRGVLTCGSRSPVRPGVLGRYVLRALGGP